jgi:hypothetical protein
MTPRDGFLDRLVTALAARPSVTTASAPLPTRTRFAAALAARPVRRADPVRRGADPDRYGDRFASAKLGERVKVVVAGLLDATADQLQVDADGDIGIRSGSAMIFVRAQEDPPLVDVFSPLLTGVPATERLYRRLSDLTNRLPVGRVYCTGDTVWASIPVFGRDFQPTHLILAIQAMVGLADELDDLLREEFGGSRFFGDGSTGLSAVPDPTNYLRDLADSGAVPANTVLVELLADRGRLDELRARAKSGDWQAASRLAALLNDRGDATEAERLWRMAAEKGEPAARTKLAALLLPQGRVDEAITVLREAVRADDWSSVGLLTQLLVERGRIGEALDLLRARPGRREATG